MTCPDIDELPVAGGGGRSAWGLFGAADSVGLLNLQTDASVLAAAGLVRKGSVFPLNAELDAVDPPLDPDRAMVRHRVLHQPGPDSRTWTTYWTTSSRKAPASGTPSPM